MVNERSFTINLDAGDVSARAREARKRGGLVTQAGFEAATPSSGGCEHLGNSSYLQTIPTAQNREGPQLTRVRCLLAELTEFRTSQLQRLYFRMS